MELAIDKPAVRSDGDNNVMEAGMIRRLILRPPAFRDSAQARFEPICAAVTNR